MDTKNIFRHAPKYVMQRFSTVHSYVWSIMYPRDELNVALKKIRDRTEKSRELSRIKDIVSEASFVVFIFLLKKFFRDGTESAIQAVDTLKGLGIQGVRIGSQLFEERNENVMKGESLANQLLNQIKDDRLKSLIEGASSARDIIIQYKQFITSSN